MAAKKGYEEANADTDSPPDGDLTLDDEIRAVAKELRYGNRTAPCFLMRKKGKEALHAVKMKQNQSKRRPMLLS